MHPERRVLVVPDEDRESSRLLTCVVEGCGFTDRCGDYARGRAGLAQVLRTYNALADHQVGVMTYAVMVGALSSLRQHRLVGVLVREMRQRGIARDLNLTCTLIENLRDRRRPDWHALRRLLREAAASPWFAGKHAPQVFRATLRVVCRWRHNRAACGVVALMGDFGYPVSPGALAGCLGTFTSSDAALAFACGLPVDFDVTVFNALIAIPARTGDVRTAWRAYRTLLAHDLTPNMRTYHALLNAHKEAVDLRGFLYVLSLMQAGGGRGTPHDGAVLGSHWRSGLEPDGLTATLLLSLCSRLVEGPDGGAAAPLDPYALAQAVFAEAAAQGRAGSLHMLQLMLRMHRQQRDPDAVEATLAVADACGIPRPVLDAPASAAAM